MTEEISSEALTQMRDFSAKTPETVWYAYRNQDLGHRDLGQLQFLAVGPGCTIKTPPPRYPDSHLGLGWRYLPEGIVNLATGKIEAKS